MKKVLIAVAIVGIVTATSIALAEETRVVVTTSGDYLGKYIWRGQNLSDDPVFQPSVAATYGPLTASIWGNMDTTNINGNSGDFSELDTTVGLAGPMPGIEGVTYTLGGIYYDFPGTAYPDTAELYAGFGLVMPLSPTLTIYRDVDEAEGSYYALGLSHNIPKIAEVASDVPVGLTAGMNLGYANSPYNKYYWGTAGSKFQDLTFSLALPVTLNRWTITPKFGYATLLSSTIRDADTYGTSSDNFFAGIGISTTF